MGKEKYSLHILSNFVMTIQNHNEVSTSADRSANFLDTPIIQYPLLTLTNNITDPLKEKSFVFYDSRAYNIVIFMHNKFTLQLTLLADSQYLNASNYSK